MLHRSCKPALVIVVVALAAHLECSGIKSVRFYADEEATIADAERSQFKFCHILSNEICQSPDSALVFHMPRALSMIPANRAVADEVVISNNGFQPIAIDEYFLMLVDDRQVQSRIRFSGPGGYNEAGAFSPALVVEPNSRAVVTFSGSISQGSSGVQSLSVSYRLVGDTDFTTVLVSYRPNPLTPSGTSPPR